MLEAVSALSLTTLMVPEDAIHEAVGNANMVMLGADTLLPDGAIVNGWPTLELAQGARDAIPFYVVCETIKLSTEPGMEAGFDVVPDSLITKVNIDTLAKST